MRIRKSTKPPPKPSLVGSLTMIEQPANYSLSPSTGTQATSPAHQAVRAAPLFALAAGAGLILLWGATHTSQSTLRSGTAEAGQVMTLSSQQLLSHLRVQGGSMSPAAGAPLPASVTVMATPPGITADKAGNWP